jgi:RNA polymerase sigma-70 factor, ECF subfamily
MDDSSRDSQLPEDLRRGDVTAFGCFYQTNSPRLRNFLRRYLRDPKTAEDIAQEAFLELWKRPGGYNPERGTLKAYLFGIAAKRAADWIRRRPAPEDCPSAARPAANGEFVALIGEALDRLEPEVRALLWLRAVEGYSYAELAEILHIPSGTVKSRLYAAREQLRRVWEGAKS